MTPEGKVKKDIKAYLDSIGAYHVWPVPTGYGPKLLDCYACVGCRSVLGGFVRDGGKFVVIEAKPPGKMPTKHQAAEITRINQAGGIAFAADSVERVKEYIEDHVLGMYEPERE